MISVVWRRGTEAFTIGAATAGLCGLMRGKETWVLTKEIDDVLTSYEGNASTASTREIEYQAKWPRDVKLKK